MYTLIWEPHIILHKLPKPWEIWICGKGTVAVDIIDKASIKTQGQTKFSTKMRKYHFCRLNYTKILVGLTFLVHKSNKIRDFLTGIALVIRFGP